MQVEKGEVMCLCRDSHNCIVILQGQKLNADDVFQKAQKEGAVCSSEVVLLRMIPFQQGILSLDDLHTVFD